MKFFVVAFIDVLGFSRMVSSDSNSESARFLPVFLKTFGEIRKAFATMAGLDVRMFSDSIVVSAPLSPESVVSVLSICAQLQRSFLANGVLVRGGVSFGKHYADEAVLFSDALINAYRLESTKARFPRIVIDKDLLDYFLNFPELNTETNSAGRSLLMRDRDGLCFVHYLTETEFSALSGFLQAVLNDQKISEETVLEKMRWLHDYHSFSAIRYGQPELAIDGLAADFSELA